MRDYDDRNFPPQFTCNTEADQTLRDWCGWQACRAHGDEALARVLHQGVAYALTRQGEQLRTMAVLYLPDGTFDWARGGGLDEGASFHARFAQMVALHGTAWEALAGAVIGEIWVPSRPLAPGERPSHQTDRKEAVVISGQGRMASPVNVIMPIIKGIVAPPPLNLPEGSEINIGWGRFIPSCGPTPAERAAAQALLKQLAAGDKRFEGTPQDEAKIAAFNPSAKPPQW